MRLDRETRSNLLQAIDDHSFARLQAVSDLSQAVVNGSDANGASDHFVLVVDEIQNLLTLVGIEGAIIDQNGVVRSADGNPDATNSPGRRTCSLLGNTPRIRMVPVCERTRLSTKLIVPS